MGKFGNQGDQQNRGNQQRQGNRQNVLPEKYLEGGYYSDHEKLKLKEEYIVSFSKDIAGMLDRDGGRDINKSSQIRKFYEYVLRVNKKMKHHGDDFSFVKADLVDLIPHVTYARKRKVVSGLFVEFIEKNVTAVENEKDMRAFVKHFEAVVAFMKKD